MGLPGTAITHVSETEVVVGSVVIRPGFSKHVRSRRLNPSWLSAQLSKSAAMKENGSNRITGFITNLRRRGRGPRDAETRGRQGLVLLMTSARTARVVGEAVHRLPGDLWIGVAS